jgi:alkylation response protein AidB-like acyl-CoA dehydrogenase
MTTTTTARGGAWLIEDAPADSIFTPEKLSDEHRLISQTADEFMTNEVLPATERLEQKDWALARQLVRRAGELGLLGADVPEALGGVGLDKVSAILVGEAAGRSASFATTFGAQTGLAITPLLCFGTDAQKAQYLPRLVSGEMVGAYALSESGSGSDALGAKARATRQPDGSFTLSGEKMWITNSGFADPFIVFAKVAGEAGEGAFTAFLVERAFPGVSSGKEEHKMGLHGSSTTPLILQDAQVPATNVLGEIGKGHKVAFNVLNYGRFKLAAMCSGGARAIVGDAATYAVQRKQFGQPIASFGAIKHKLAEIAIREFAVESMLYRTAALIDAAIDAGGPAAASTGDSVLAALEEFAIEASILKVAGSEMIDYAVDENVQIHGGNGFVRDYPAERMYRDARVNRIFEGTNEINRLLIPGMLIRRALKGGLPLIPAAKKLQDEILTPSFAEPPSDEPLENERRTVAAMKKAALMVLGTAMQTYGDKLTDQQEVLTLAADVIIDVFAAESVLLRASQGARAQLDL